MYLLQTHAPSIARHSRRCYWPRRWRSVGPRDPHLRTRARGRRGGVRHPGRAHPEQGRPAATGTAVTLRPAPLDWPPEVVRGPSGAPVSSLGPSRGPWRAGWRSSRQRPREHGPTASHVAASPALLSPRCRLCRKRSEARAEARPQGRRHGHCGLRGRSFFLYQRSPKNKMSRKIRPPLLCKTVYRKVRALYCYSRKW